MGITLLFQIHKYCDYIDGNEFLTIVHLIVNIFLKVPF